MRPTQTSALALVYIGPILVTHCVPIFIAGNYCWGNIGLILVAHISRRTNIVPILGRYCATIFYIDKYI